MLAACIALGFVGTLVAQEYKYLDDAKPMFVAAPSERAFFCPLP